MDSVQQAILNAIAVILTALIGLITSKVVSWLEEKKVTEKIFNKREIVGIVVSAIEQIYSAEDGPKKLQQAKLMAVDMLNQNGIKVTENELNALIEEAVRNIHHSIDEGTHLVQLSPEGNIEWVENIDTETLTIPLKDEESFSIDQEKNEQRKAELEILLQTKKEIDNKINEIQQEVDSLK